MTLEERVIELETKVAFQDDTIQKLNEVVIEQEKSIELLTRQAAELIVRLKELTPSNIASETEETPPPHYSVLGG